MNNLPRNILCEMVGRYGPSLAQDPVRCEGLLRDSCNRCGREIFVLVHAVRQKVPAELLEPRHALPLPLLKGFLAKRLQDELGFSDIASRWAVETWALALGIDGDNTIPAEPEENKPLIRRDPASGNPAPEPCDAVLREQWADCLASGSLRARLDAIDGLSRSRDPACVALLIGALGNTLPRVRLAAYDALASQRELAVPYLIEALGDSRDDVVWRSAILLGGMGSPRAGALLAGLLDRTGKVRISAIWALGEIGDQDASTPLMKLLNHPDPLVKNEVVAALRKIGRASS